MVACKKKKSYSYQMLNTELMEVAVSFFPNLFKRNTKKNHEVLYLKSHFMFFVINSSGYSYKN